MKIYALLLFAFVCTTSVYADDECLVQLVSTLESNMLIEVDAFYKDEIEHLLSTEKNYTIVPEDSSDYHYRVVVSQFINLVIFNNPAIKRPASTRPRFMKVDVIPSIKMVNLNETILEINGKQIESNSSCTSEIVKDDASKELTEELKCSHDYIMGELLTKFPTCERLSTLKKSN